MYLVYTITIITINVIIEYIMIGFLSLLATRRKLLWAINEIIYIIQEGPDA